MSYPDPPALPVGPLNPSLLATDENVFVNFTGVQEGEDSPLGGDEMKAMTLLEELYKTTRRNARPKRGFLSRNYCHLVSFTSSANYAMLASPQCLPSTHPSSLFTQAQEEHQPPSETNALLPLADDVAFYPRLQQSPPVTHNDYEPASLTPLQSQLLPSGQKRKSNHTCHLCGETFLQPSKLR